MPQRNEPVGAALLRPGEGAHGLNRFAWLVAVLLLTLTTGSLAFASDEAERQAQFARQELDEGKFDRALKSAESALRLDPIFYEALGLKALAYEGLGQLRLAESLLLTWKELAGDGDLPTHYAQALLRVRERQEDKDNQRRQRQKGRVIEIPDDPIPVIVEVVASEPEVYRQRSQKALEEGQCHGAMSAATELAQADPHGAASHRLLGDAHRCLGELPEAARAYRRSLAIDGEQESVTDLLADLATMLASLEVQVSLSDDQVVPLMQLEIDGERIDPFFRDRSIARFADLPTGHGGLLLVAGRGLRPVSRELAPLAPAEGRIVEITPEVVGLATVEFGAFDPQAVRVTLHTPDEELAPGPGESRDVTADDVRATVVTDLGSVEVELGLAAGETVRFEPARNLPAGLTLSKVPSGSKVTVVAEGRGEAVVERVREVPADVGTIDPVTGLRLAPPLRIDSLVGGRAGVWLEHPVLGSVTQEVVLESGAWSAALVDIDKLEGVAAIRSRYQAWSQSQGAGKQTQRQAATAAGIVAGVLLAGGATALALSQVAADRRIRPGLVCAAIGPDADSCSEAAGLKTQQDVLLGGGIAAVGLGAASVTLSIGLGSRARKARSSTGSWDPWADAPVVEPGGEE